MKFKSFAISVLLICFLGLSAQDSSKKILFTIDDSSYYTDEFVRVYQKNLDLVKDESQKDLNQYLDLFVGYKLKIKKANQLGLQDGTAYKNELKSYRDQLAKNYVTDSKVTEELIEEAYERSKKEVNASHILLMVDENASPQDTLKVYQRIMDIRKRAIQGEDFGALAQSMSEDPSAKENLGNLGYFSVFRMVYPFENAAFKTPVGQISMPVRTRFGYHLVKVNTTRENRGEVQVAHIMIFSAMADGTPNAEAESTINDIYKKLQQGESFEDLARQFSQDQATAAKGGVLNPFASGQLSSEEFENTAFSLTKENPISKPIQTQYGWHIVKLIDRIPMKSFDFSKQEIETKISRDDRSRLIEQSINEKLHQRYPVKKNDKNYQLALKAATNLLYTNEWKLPENLKPFQGVLVQFANQSFAAEEFLKYLFNQQKEGYTIKPLTKLVNQKYQDFVDFKLKEFYNANLENEYPEFGMVMEEYRDGLLLFELMEKEIWTKSKNDTIGLAAYFEKNNQKYQWKNRYDAMIISTTKADVAKKAHKMVKKGKTQEEIKLAFNTPEVVNVMITTGLFEENSEALPKNLTPKEGISQVLQQDKYYYVVVVNEFIPAGPKVLEECKGRVINDYQQNLEENWVTQLKSEFKVQVDASVFEEVKPEAIARTGDAYLYQTDIAELVPEGTSKEDSISIVRNFMDRWATQALLINAAEVNVSQENQLLFNKLIQQYKVDLYTKAYLEEIVKQSIDTVVSEEELKAYYNLNKENFKTNGALVKLRYLLVSKEHPKLELIKQNFFNFKKKDSKFWETYQLQFKEYALNDSVWVDVNHVYRKLPFVNPDTYFEYIVAGKAIQKPDSSDVYLVKVSNVIKKNEVSPFAYIKPTMRDLIINQRKLELIKKFENELRDDAIKNKKYEVYQ